ncbi:MAG TPA: MOSC N-terminal beta barrel domain-containing protein [Acidimicrobiia bacterium]|nr:MOSC N-terminal beta barrel domain-containing protein [Acidimicrobiia bacterium]
MQILRLWRYPVKSLQGEQLGEADVTPDGLAGDRRYGIVDVARGTVLTGRREPRLLFASASLSADGALTITLPDGSVARDDDALSSWLGKRVQLRAASPDFAAKYETQLVIEDDPNAEWFAWEGPAGRFHDSTRTVVSLVTTTTMRDWDERRFRANVVLEGDGEDELVGTTVRLGSVELEITKPIDRCVMVTREQPEGIARELDVLKTIHAQRAGNLAIGALVTTPGRIAVGDELLPRD